MKHSSVLRTGMAIALLALAGACSDDDDSASVSKTGGAAGRQTGGTKATSGGTTTSGGKAAGGTAGAAAGSTSTGGKSSTGGAVASGGAAVGGSTSVGGAPVAGGASSVGGVAGIAGSTVGGETVVAGSTSMGGAGGIGGEAIVGGSTSLAGAPASGGVVAVGGETAVAGSTAAGGTSTAGGEAGSAAEGGTTPIGGGGGAAPEGGTGAEAGTAGAGGSTTEGGAGGVGGSGGTDPFAAAEKFPSIGATDVPVDAWFSLTFDSAPTLGTSGRIYVRKVSDDSQVDVINLADSPGTVTINNVNNFRTLTPTQANLTSFGFNTAVNYLGNDTVAYGRTAGRVRIVKYNPVRVVGNQLRIYPHDGLLAYGTAYYITIDNGAVTGTLGGAAFAGVTSSSAWTFTTKAAAPTGAAWTVNADGTSGNFMTVQGAINAVPPSNPSTITVTVADGTYEELLYDYAKNNLVINGQSRTGTIIKFENYETYLPGTGGGLAYSATGTSYTTPNGDTITVPIADPTTLYEGGRTVLHIQGATNVEMNRLTVQNTHVKAGSSGNQAEAFYFNNENGNFISRDSNWVGSQDTVQLKGYSWFYNSLITGDVDFVWGAPKVALFENSELRTRVDASSGGYVVQSRTPAPATGANPSPGFIFLNSTFTAETGVPDGATYLGRNGGTYPDSVVYTNCTLGSHIAAAGYTSTAASATATAVMGRRQFGLKDASAADWNVASLTGFYALSSTENSALYASREIIFGGATVTDGTAIYASTAWTLSTTY